MIERVGENTMARHNQYIIFVFHSLVDILYFLQQVGSDGRFMYLLNALSTPRVLIRTKNILKVQVLKSHRAV